MSEYRAEQYEHPVSPVRDDHALGATEDLDRKPGGFPHRMMAATGILLLGTVIVIFVALEASSIAAFLVGILAIFSVVAVLRRESSSERDHVHPSR
jgi:hypothetical protein